MQVDSQATTGTRSLDAATVDLSGRCVGNSYILIRPIGHGATGTVWRAADRGSGEQVAVKLLHESLLRQPKLVTRFVQERTILLMLRHPNVVRVRDLFSAGESLGLVMDLVGGGSLRARLREHGTVAPGEPETRLTDFGIARVLSTPGLTTPHAVVGTPYYMAPEAFHGAPTDPKVDVYALGVLLYEMVTGRPPYVEDSIPELMRRHLEDRPERRDGVPDELWAVIGACMDRDARKRPTAADLVGTLAGVARSAAGVAALPVPKKQPELVQESGMASEQHVPVPRSHPSLPGSALPPKQRRNQAPAWRWARPWLFTLLVLVAMAGSGIGVSLWQSGSAEGSAEGSDEAMTLPLPPRLATTTPAAAAPSKPAQKATPVAQAGAARAGTALPSVAGPARTRPAAGKPNPPARVPEARPYGPYACRDLVGFTLGYPLVAKPCHALGSAVRVLGKLAAAPGTSADVTLRLLDTGTGRTAATHRCGTLRFSKGAMTQSCGPVDLVVPRGRRYVLVQSWVYRAEGEATQGSAKGTEFAW